MTNKLGDICKIDEKNRVVLPTDLIDEKNLNVGDFVIFEKINNDIKLSFRKAVKI